MESGDLLAKPPAAVRLETWLSGALRAPAGCAGSRPPAGLGASCDPWGQFLTCAPRACAGDPVISFGLCEN